MLPMTPDRFPVGLAWPVRFPPPPAPKPRRQLTPADALRQRVLELSVRHRFDDDTSVWTRSPSGLVLRHSDRWAAYRHVATRPNAQRQRTTFHDHNPARARKQR